MNAQEWLEQKGQDVVLNELQVLIRLIVKDNVEVILDWVENEDLTLLYKFDDGSYWNSSLYLDDIDDDFDSAHLLAIIADRGWDDYVYMPENYMEFSSHQQNFIDKLREWLDEGGVNWVN